MSEEYILRTLLGPTPSPRVQALVSRFRDEYNRALCCNGSNTCSIRTILSQLRAILSDQPGAGTLIDRLSGLIDTCETPITVDVSTNDPLGGHQTPMCRMCSNRTYINTLGTAYVCGSCGLVMESEIHLVEGCGTPGSKQGDKHMDHFTTWVNCIWAKVSNDCIATNTPGNEDGSLTIAAICKFARARGINLATMTATQVRWILKNTSVGGKSLTCFNKYVSHILVRVGQQPPPEVPAEIDGLASVYFAKFINQFNILEEGKDKNSPYYPQVILRIYEALIDDPAIIHRLLPYVYLQRADTVDDNDAVICKIFEKIGLAFPRLRIK